MLLSGKKIIVTGGSLGLGKTIAEHFVQQGANLLICSRNLDQLKKTHENLIAQKTNTTQIIDYFQCDVANKKDVSTLFEASLEKLKGIDVIVNNAGVYGPKGSSETVDTDEWVNAIEINLFGTFYMCQEAIRIFKKQGSGKIINLSGGGATAPLPNFSAYAASKAAVVRLTETLAEEVKEFGIDINAIAPGSLNTRLLDEVMEAGEEKVGKEFYQKMLKQKDTGGVSLDTGADLCVFLASSKSNGITGKLIAAVWDGWDNFEDHLDEIKNTDIFTLRRIIPKDRNMDWE